MRCKRNNCNGPMQLRGYGKDRYYSCILCGNMIYVNPASQAQIENGRKKWLSISVAEQ